MRALLVLLAVSILALAVPASGDEIIVWLNGSGGGDFMLSPVVLSGTAMIDYADPGLWSITVPDAAFPVDPVAREQYIWDNFYASNYFLDPPRWIGHFGTGVTVDGHDIPATLPELNELYVEHTGIGTMVGVCSIEIQVDDLDGDGELDENEWCQNSSLSGLVILIREGTGRYDGYCGEGYYFGTRTIDCPNTDESWMFGMDLWLEPCPSPVENASWGTIKALYQ